jgi:hypothetical protein
MTTRLLLSLTTALKSLKASPTLSLLAIGTLAAGIGATTTVFSLADQILLRPIDFGAHTGRVVSVNSSTPTSARPRSRACRGGLRRSLPVVRRVELRVPQPQHRSRRRRRLPGARRSVTRPIPRAPTKPVWRDFNEADGADFG